MTMHEGDEQLHRLNRFREQHPDVQVVAPAVNPGLPFQWMAKQNNRLVGCGHDLEMLLDTLEGMDL
jgi:hypothetical protein